MIAVRFFANYFHAELIKTPVKAFIQEWGRGFRWSPKAEQLFQEAFPNASYDGNIGLDLGRSGTCAIVTDNKEYPAGSMIVFKSSLGVRSGANNHMYNRARGWVIPPTN